MQLQMAQRREKARRFIKYNYDKYIQEFRELGSVLGPRVFRFHNHHSDVNDVTRKEIKLKLKTDKYFRRYIQENRRRYILEQFIPSHSFDCDFLPNNTLIEYFRYKYDDQQLCFIPGGLIHALEFVYNSDDLNTLYDKGIEIIFALNNDVYKVVDIIKPKWFFFY